MDNDIELYRRYNRVLLRQINYFIEQNQDLMNNSNFEKEFHCLQNLKTELQRSAAIKKQISTKSVPLIKIYTYIYSKLFEDKLFEKSYFSILKKYVETKKITPDEKIENQLLKKRKEIMTYLNNVINKSNKSDLTQLENKFPIKKIQNSFLRVVLISLILANFGGQFQKIYGQTTNNPKQQELVQEKNNLNLNKEELNKLNELLGKLEFGENKFQTTEGKKIFVNKLKMSTGDVKIEFNGNAGSFSISSFPYLNIDSTGIIKLIPPFLDMMKFQLEKKGESEENIQKVINKMYSKIYEEKQLNKIINGIIINK